MDYTDGEIIQWLAQHATKAQNLYQVFVIADGAFVMRELIRAGALFAGAVVLRLVLSGAYSSLVSHWTLR